LNFCLLSVQCAVADFLLSQLFDQFLEDSWSAESSGSKSVNTSDLWPNYLWLNQCSPLVYNFDDLQSLDDPKSGSNLSICSSPPEFGLPSPISDSSSLSAEDAFDQKSLIDLWAVPTPFENDTNTLTASCNSPSGEDFPGIMIPGLASSPSSSESNSPRDVEHDMRIKGPTPRARKHQSGNSRAKSPCLKPQNAHNLIEKRYRNNLNCKINTLRDSIPSLRSAKKENEESEDGMDSNAVESRKTQKCNKGIILDKAVEYIAELEKQIKSTSKANAALQLMIKDGVPSYLMLGSRR